MKVVMPALIENPTTEAEIAQNELRAKYVALFAELQGDYEELFAAQHPAVVISDLISYFRALDLVTILSDSNNPVPSGWVLPNGQRPAQPKNKFYRMPLDEPFFEINTDTRTITVPSEFYNNGLGVQGDANAEIVFFKCPRLFDTIDLYSMVAKGNCWVQWTNNGSRASGNSQVLLCDVTQDYMYLGWMITAAMTTVAGAVDFSVRWFVTEGEGDDERITYSLSTQKATCNIKSTMDLDLGKIAVENMSSLVYTRPIYAHVINSMEGLSPRISKQLETGNYNLEAIDEEDENYAALIAKYPLATYPDGIKIFEVTASSPDEKTVTYQWYKNGAALAGEIEEARGSKGDKYTAVTPGTYHVIIGNGDASGYRYVTSPTVVVPSPVEIKYINEAANKFFGFGCYSNGTPLTADITAVDGTAPNGKVQVEWFLAPMVKNGALVAKDDAVFGDEAVATQNLTKQDNKTYVTGSYTPAAKTEGWVKCVAKNKLNNANSAAITTEKLITLRAEPDQPTNVTIVWDAENRSIKVTNVTFPEGSTSGLHKDELRYRWNDGSEISAQNGSGFGDDHKILRITPPSEDAEITYLVKVSHRVYGDNKVAAGAEAGTAVQKESSAKASNTITLKFTYGGASTPTITVI